MQFPLKLICLTLLLITLVLATPQNLKSSYKARELPDPGKRNAFGKAHARPNILFIITDDQGIYSVS
jgi:hypothetical protein